MHEDSATNFLTKLGLITDMIDDVTQFRIRMKRSRSRNNDNRKRSEDGDDDDVGMNVGATEAIWKLKKRAKHDDLKLASKDKKKRPHSYYKLKGNSLAEKKNRRNNYYNRKYRRDELVKFSGF
jgi:hypothetical protein